MPLSTRLMAVRLLSVFPLVKKMSPFASGISEKEFLPNILIVFLNGFIALIKAAAEKKAGRVWDWPLSNIFWKAIIQERMSKVFPGKVLFLVLNYHATNPSRKTITNKVLTVMRYQ